MRCAGPRSRWGRLVVAISLLAGCGGEPAPETAAEGVPAATAACAEVAFPPLQFGSHLLGDAEPPVPYSSSPPSSGWHIAGAPPVGVADDPVADPVQVATLEAGGVVITHGDLPEADLAALVEVADANPRSVLLTPHPDLGAGDVVLTSWGAQQRCEAVDVAAAQAYVDAYGSDVTAFEEEAEVGEPSGAGEDGAGGG